MMFLVFFSQILNFYKAFLSIINMESIYLRTGLVIHQLLKLEIILVKITFFDFNYKCNTTHSTQAIDTHEFYRIFKSIINITRTSFE